jgi:hypothetical protein
MYVTGTSAAQDANNNISLVWDMNDVLGLESLTAADFQVIDLTPQVTGLSASSGTAGNVITVTGQNYSGAAGHLTVLFGTTPATSVTYVDDSHLSVVVPSSSGTVDVQVQSGIIEIDPNNPKDNVTNPIFGHGLSATSSADQFTFTAQTISSVNSTDSFAAPSLGLGMTDLLTILVKDTTGTVVSGLPSSAFSFALSGGTSNGSFGPVSETSTPGTYTTTFTSTQAGTLSHLTTTVNGVTLNAQPSIVVVVLGGIGVGHGIVGTGAGPGGGPQVNVYDATTGALLWSFMAYDANFLGGVRVAVGDVNGDGVPDIITAPGAGGGPDVRVYDGATGNLIREFMAYDPSFLGGVYVAAGDVNADGFADIITGADAGGGPEVRVFSGKDGSVLQSFFAYDPRFPGGVRVAAGDVKGDGHADIITGAGPGGGPEVRVFDGVDGSILQDYFAYAPTFTGGVYVAAGDVNGDGKADVITGAGAGGGPEVRVFSGANGSVLQSCFAYDPRFPGGVRVAYVPNANGQGQIATGAGPGGGPEAELFNGSSLSVMDAFFAYNSGFPGGLYVGGA